MQRSRNRASNIMLRFQTSLLSFVLLCSCEGSEPASSYNMPEGNQAADSKSASVVPQPDPDRYKVTSPGPLELDKARRVKLPQRSTGNSPPMISPDGTKFFAYNAIQGLWVGEIASNNEPKHPVGRVSGAGFGHAETIPFSWSEQSQTIFGAKQATADPSGFALGPMFPVEITHDGEVRDLPQLAHPAGNLDGLLWVGGRGLALALFGAKGDYYRPEIENLKPAIAFVNAAKGRLIQSSAIPSPVKEDLRSLILGVDARIDANGHAFALLAISGHPSRTRLFAWHQDRPLRELSWDTGRLTPKRYAVSSSLDSVLIMHDLSATGIICEVWSNQECPAPTPTTGTVAELRDLASGRVIWSINGTAKTFGRSLKPAISDDGSLALISMPRTGKGGDNIALISMRDGRIIQELDGVPSIIDGMGFRDNDRSVWLSGQELLLTYHLRR